MKARVKSTGVLVDVTPQLNINSQHNNNYLYVCDNMVYRECELDFFSETIDWEQRRYELAKATAMKFLRNRIRFFRPDGTRGDSPGCGSILIAFGEDNAEILRNCDIAGKYVRIN